MKITQEVIFNWFQEADKDKSGSLTDVELQKLLKKKLKMDIDFKLSTTRAFIGMFDQNNSNEIEIQEFAQLVPYISDWLEMFKQMDSDRSGHIDVSELKQALNTFGHKLSHDMVVGYIRSFGGVDKTVRNGGVFSRRKSVIRGLSFDEFVNVFVVVTKISNEFREKQRGGRVEMDLEGMMKFFLKVHPE